MKLNSIQFSNRCKYNLDILNNILDKKIYSITTSIVLILFQILYNVHYAEPQTECPSFCQQQPCQSGKLICIEPYKLTALPLNIPKIIFYISISGQNFINTTLSYHSLSHYGPEQINLRVLQITFTNIENIEPEAFSHLISLKSLDLSNNRLKILHGGIFKGLSLDYLRLDNNENLVLVEGSFRGLVVSTLSLKSCILRNLSYETIKEVSGHLTKLYLSDNSLTGIDKKFELLFERLDIIDLEKNPFYCTCQLKWLTKSLKTRDNSKEKPQTLQPRCTHPKELNGQTLISLSESDLICKPPVVKEIDIFLFGNNSGRLSCEAMNSLETNVRWRHKLYALENYYRFQDYSPSLGRSIIKIESQNSVDHYSCYVQNSKGKVNIDVNIMWPPNNNSNIIQKSNEVTYIYNNNLEDNNHLNLNNNPLERFFMRKQFSLFELLISMIATLIVTSFLSTLCFCFFFKHRFLPSLFKGSQPMTDSAVTSEVQMHNMSQFPSNQELKANQLLDFKTQQILPLVMSQSNWSLKI